MYDVEWRKLCREHDESFELGYGLDQAGGTYKSIVSHQLIQLFGDQASARQCGPRIAHCTPSPISTLFIAWSPLYKKYSCVLKCTTNLKLVVKSSSMLFYVNKMGPDMSILVPD